MGSKRTKRQPLTLARAVATAWLTSVCGRPSVLWSLQRRQAEAQPRAPQIISKLQCWKPCTARVLRAPALPVAHRAHRPEGAHRDSSRLWPLSSATLSRLSQIGTQSSRAQGHRSALSGYQAAWLFLRYKSRHSSLKKNVIWPQGAPTPRKNESAKFFAGGAKD